MQQLLATKYFTCLETMMYKCKIKEIKLNHYIVCEEGQLAISK